MEENLQRKYNIHENGCSHRRTAVIESNRCEKDNIVPFFVV